MLWHLVVRTCHYWTFDIKHYRLFFWRITLFPVTKPKLGVATTCKNGNHEENRNPSLPYSLASSTIFWFLVLRFSVSAKARLYLSCKQGDPVSRGLKLTNYNVFALVKWKRLLKLKSLNCCKYPQIKAVCSHIIQDIELYYIYLIYKIHVLWTKATSQQFIIN